MKRTLLPFTVWAFAAVLSLSSTARAQNGRYDNVAFSSSGRPAPGVNVAVCSTLTTTAAAVTSNVATLTFSSNPVTAGFLAGFTLTVSGFTGGDTYFNGSFTISATSSTTISFGLTHANASAGMNGSVYMTGTSAQACAPLASLMTDSTGATSSSNPFTADGLGNYGFWVQPNNYKVQLYGPTITTTIFNVSIACVPAGINCGAPLNGNNAWTGNNTFTGQNNLNNVYALNNILSVGGNITNWAGADVCAQVNSAYASMTQSGIIKILPALNGSQYSCTTAIVLNTADKYVLLDGGQQGPVGGSTGAVTINFTSTAAQSTTAESITTNVATFTMTANPITFGFIAGEIIAVASCVDSTFNGNYNISTVTSTQITFAITHVNASTTGCTVAPTAITLDYVGIGGSQIGHGISNISLTNNNCSTTGGCGSAAMGIGCGFKNTGCQFGIFSNVNITGFGSGEYIISQLSYGIQHNNVFYQFNTNGFNQQVPLEMMTWNGGQFLRNSVGILATAAGVGSDMSANSVHFDDNTTWAVQLGTQAFPSIFSFKDCHFENLAGGTQHYISGGTATSINMVGGHMGDDNTIGTGDFMVQTAGATFTAFGTTINSQRTATTILQANTPVRVWAQFVDQTQNTSPTLITGTSNSINDFSINGINAGGGRAQIFGEGSLAPKAQGGASLGTSTSGQWSNYFGYQFDILEAGAPAAGGAFHDNCYADSTAHALECSYNNNATFSRIPLTSAADTTTTHVLHASATANIYTPSAIAVGDLPTAIPIGNVGSAGLSATAPIRIAATGVIDCAGAAQCVTSAAALTNNSPVLGGALQASKTASFLTTDGAAVLTVGVAGGGNGGLALAGTTSGTATLTAPAVAGTATNPATFTNSLQLPSGTVYNWNADTGLSRDAAAIVDIGNGTAGNASAFERSGNTVAVTSNFTTASATLVTITGLSWTFPATNHNYRFFCHLSYSQATAAAANSWGVQATTTAPTNLYAAQETNVALTPTGAINGTLPTLATTTATNIGGTFTPSAFGAIGTVADIFTAKIWGYLEQGAGATTLNIMALTGNVGDSLTIYRGSSCSLGP